MSGRRLGVPARPGRRRVPALAATVGRASLVNGVALLFGLALFAYLTLDLVLFLPLLLLIAAVGADQVLRPHASGRFVGLSDTLLYLFVPVLFALGSALFLNDVVTGFWTVVGTVAATALFTAVLHATYLSVDGQPDSFPLSRFVLSLTGYLTAFALFTVVFTSEMPLPAATFVVAAVALLLAIDLLREMDISTTALVAHAAAIGAIVAETRWAMYYLGLGNLLAGALLLVTYYVATGVVQSHLSGQLDRRTAVEYGVIGGIGLLIVTAARIVIDRV